MTIETDVGGAIYRARISRIGEQLQKKGRNKLRPYNSDFFFAYLAFFAAKSSPP